MQQEFYTSCIKINGIPLLPPLMTDSTKEEMRHYRSLAIKVEEKIRNKLAKRVIKDKCVQANIIEPVDELRDIKYSSDSDISNRDTMSDTNNSDSHSKMTIVEPTSIRQTTEKTRDEHNILSPTSDVKYAQLQASLTNHTDTNSKSVTSMIDQNEYVNVTETTMLNDVLTESWKPEVPRTLDIVPITLSDEGDSDRSLALVSKENENLPKLLRQGSYVLDTPSPMLLAHMHTESIDKNYVPTSTTNVSQRKQWNIAQPKMEWENKQSIAEDTKTSHKSEYTVHKSTSHTESDVLTESYQTKSVGSIKEVIAEEHVCSSAIIPIKHNYISNTDVKKQSSLEKSKSNSETYALNSVNKEFTEDVNNPDANSPQLFHIAKNRHDNMEDIKNYQSSIVKTKSPVIPKKLLTVYKEIEEMHKKQMMELIHRQWKEQSLLQAEFRKQQMLLLTEMRKCSSTIPYQVDVSNITSNQPLSNNEERPRNTDSETGQQLNVNLARNLHMETHYDNKLSPASRENVIVCPLDYISAKNLYVLKQHKSCFVANTSPATLDFDFTRKVNLYDTTHNNNNNDDNANCESHYSVYKNSSVSRQLFPLDSNTTHVPIIDTSVYLDKHIRAVNIINAYARGYLVRRLMRTERVITLKKIYKEALQCMLKLHVDAPLNLAEVDFLHRLQLQCDAASMNIVELFVQSPTKTMKVIAQDREIKQSRAERPTSARSYSFATQKTLARKNLKEFESTMTKYQRPFVIKKNIIRSRCQTWTSDIRDSLMSPNTLNQGIKRSTSAGTVRKPWR